MATQDPFQPNQGSSEILGFGAAASSFSPDGVLAFAVISHTAERVPEAKPDLIHAFSSRASLKPVEAFHYCYLPSLLTNSYHPPPPARFRSSFKVGFGVWYKHTLRVANGASFKSQGFYIARIPVRLHLDQRFVADSGKGLLSQ